MNNMAIPLFLRSYRAQCKNCFIVYRKKETKVLNNTFYLTLGGFEPEVYVLYGDALCLQTIFKVYVDYIELNKSGHC